MILYRVTSAAVAAAILARGFKDFDCRYGSQSAVSLRPVPPCRMSFGGENCPYGQS